MLRESYTAIVERSEELSGSFATEPYECGWAGEAIFFVRILERVGNLRRPYTPRPNLAGRHTLVR